MGNFEPAEPPLNALDAGATDIAAKPAADKDRREAISEYFKSLQENRLKELTADPNAPAVLDDAGDPEATKTEQVEDAPEGAPAAKTNEPANVDTEAIAAGVSAFKRLGVPANVIEAMSRADLANYGKEASRQVASQAELSRELGELRTKATRLAALEAASTKVEQPVFDVEAFKKRLAPTLDEEAVDALSEFTTQSKALNDQLRAEIKALREEIEPIRASQTAATVEKAKAGLKERFPQLGEQAGFEKVLQRMALLNRKGEDGSRPYSDAAELMLHACRVELDEKPSQKPTQQPRARAQSPVTDNSRQAPRPRSMREVVKQAVELSKNPNLSADEIAARVRGRTA